jgi:hypothetical protein
MSYLVVASLRNSDLRDRANQLTAEYNPVIENNKYIIHVASMYEAYRIQDRLRIDDKRCRVAHHIWHNVAVKLAV